MDTAIQAMRLRDGFHLLPSRSRGPTKSAGWLLYTPQYQWVQLNADPDEIARLHTILHDQSLDGAGQQAALAEQQAEASFRAFQEYGILTARTKTREPTQTTEPSPQRWLSPHEYSRLGDIYLVGKHALVPALQDALQKNQTLQTFETLQQWYASTLDQSIRAHKPSGQQHVLIHISHWQADRDWEKLDAWCVEHGWDWLSVYHEGEHLLIGPYYKAKAGIRYRDVKLRQLSCADYPSALQDYFEYIDGELPKPTPSSPSSQIHTLACSQITQYLSDLDSHTLEGTTGTGIGLQISVHLPSGSITSHRILPVPIAATT